MIPARHRQMLLSILDLGQVTVNDIMIPERKEIAAIDIRENWDDILDQQLRNTLHIPAYPSMTASLRNLIGLLHMKRVAHELARGTLTRERLAEIARTREPYFVPEETPLNTQLTHNLQPRAGGPVVNEYEPIEGIQPSRTSSRKLPRR